MDILMKSTIGIKNSLKELDNRSELAEERINKLEDKSIESMYAEDQGEKRRRKNERSPIEMQDTISTTNT